jgi:NADH-quinone oxidoreductase subunit F
VTLQTLDTHRVIPLELYADLAEYMDAGGGRGLTLARTLAPDAIIAELEASGLRGRGGAGFPTGAKWRTIAEYASAVLETNVVVNAAEGEPGTFKDRTILRVNPYAVLEGALIAAHAMGAQSVIIATKQRFDEEIASVRAAIAEMHDAGWVGDVGISVVEGPTEYLYGEETALLEVLDGRPPFPRIAPPWRRGVVEVVADDSDVTSGSGLAADVEMATTATDNLPPPVLVNNVETLANVPAIIAHGAAWFRSVGTEKSPGTVVCTLTGAVRRPKVVEVAMGTPLRDVIAEASNEPGDGRRITGVLMGVSNSMVSPDAFDTPISYEALAAIGSGLGSASFIVLDERSDGVAVAAGASRFLAVESCGQCEPCKRDGLEISGHLARLVRNEADPAAIDVINHRLTTIADGARCNLAAQHQVVVGSILAAFDGNLRDHLDGRRDPAEPTLIAELLRIDGDKETVDSTFATKQPDWTYEPVDSGETPVERLTDHRE